MSQLVIPTHYECMGFEQITVADTAVGLTQTEFKPKDVNRRAAHCAVITLEGTAGTNDIRWTVDGTTPTLDAGTAVGHKLVAGQELVIQGLGNLVAFRAIRAGGTSGKISVSYF